VAGWMSRAVFHVGGGGTGGGAGGLFSVQRAQLLLDGIATGLVQLGGLDALLDAGKLPLEHRERAGVEHLVLDLGQRGTPEHQKQLLLEAGGRGALALVLVRVVVDGEAALVGARPVQILQEVVVARLPHSQPLHLDHQLVLDDKHRIAMLLQLANLLEDLPALAAQIDSRCHFRVSGAAISKVTSTVGHQWEKQRASHPGLKF